MPVFSMVKNFIISSLKKYKYYYTAITFAITILIVRQFAACSSQPPITAVAPTTVDNVANQLIPADPSPVPGDTMVDIAKKQASRKEDSLKIVIDLAKDKNAETPCEVLLEEYRVLVEAYIRSNFSETTYKKYEAFAYIQDEDGNIRPAPKLEACKQDSVYRKAFDDLDRQMTSNQ